MKENPMTREESLAKARAARTGRPLQPYTQTAAQAAAEQRGTRGRKGCKMPRLAAQIMPSTMETMRTYCEYNGISFGACVDRLVQAYLSDVVPGALKPAPEIIGGPLPPVDPDQAPRKIDLDKVADYLQRALREIS